MTGFESYLLENGWKPYVFNFKERKEVEYLKPISYSTLCIGYAVYIKNERRLLFGLNERNYAPSIISPRPVTAIKNDDGSYTVTESDINDMNRLLNEHQDDYSKLIDILFN